MASGCGERRPGRCVGVRSSGVRKLLSCCALQRPPGGCKRASEGQLASCLRNDILHGEDWFDVGQPIRKLPKRVRFKDPSKEAEALSQEGCRCSV